MATLVLSTVGTALAGPVGGLLGSLVGQGIDQQLLGGGPRKGPRLGDISVQSSSYGTPIPRIYGRMRVAGTMVWATDLKENSELQGDGKSQPETVVYTYSASFAVALSSRQAVRVERIWADGKLVRGAAGDLKVSAKFRFYRGNEAQPVDPLVGTIEGAGQSPAYRGLALAVFEDLQLGDFGNRIPDLTFELVADEGAGVSIEELMADASGGAIECTDTRTVGGYAAHGQDIASAVAPLVEAFALELHDDGDAFRSPADDQRSVAEVDLGANAGLAPGSPLFERQQAPATKVPAAVALSFYDPARDFQTGLARVASPGLSRTARALAVPCVLDAGNAKAAAENLLLRGWALRERLTVRLPMAYADLHPGALLRLPSGTGDWVAEEVEIERFVVAVVLRPAWAGIGSRSADSGRSNPQPDIVAGATRLALFDLPDPETSQPTLVLAAASPSDTWQAVPIEIEVAGVISASRTAPGETVLGEAITELGDGQAFLYDIVNQVDVQLANPDHWLQSRDDTALAMGANLAVIGDELIQFADATVLAPGRFRLSRLLRGRRGSEWATHGHAIGEDFALLDARTIKAIALPIEAIGSTVTIKAHGPGDMAGPPTASRGALGEAMRPLSPAHVRADFALDGSLGVTWVRRSRLAWGWTDHIEAPVDNAVHGYRVTAMRSGGSLQLEVSDNSLVLSPSQLAALGTGPIIIEVRQIGSLAVSRPAAVTLNA